MSDYQGMRWFKCDLQIQTPEDGAHWDDVELSLGEPRRPLVAPQADINGVVGSSVPDESGIQEKARRFLRRCHELDLHVVGITDHNYSSKHEPRDWFITHLVEQNKSVARDLNRDPLYILPGFEVDIGYHVLCLFEPAKKVSHLSRVNMILTKLGLTENQRFRAGRPEPLRSNNATVSLKLLLEIVQGEHNGIVIAAHSDQNDGLLTNARNIKDYQLEDLLAVEVTSIPVGNIKNILEGTNREWSRAKRNPAFIMSSDAKSLKVDGDGKPVANSLGYRFTWLKMSKPSIESLRQAFLDNTSRIHLNSDCPVDSHPRIISIEVRGAAFLEDKKLHFAPNLNCIIGGRGSGKSTLLEYLRFVMESDQNPSLHDEVKKKHASIRSTIDGREAELRVTFEVQPGVVDTIVLNLDQDVHSVDGRAVHDLSTVLKQLQVQFFSQGELSYLTKPEQNQLLRLIDVACGNDLMELQSKENEQRTKIQQLFSSRHQLAVLEADIKRITQELEEMNRQWQARKDIQHEALAHQRAQVAKRYLKQIIEDTKSDKEKLLQLTNEIKENHKPIGKQSDDWPHTEWYRAFDIGVAAARENLQQDIETAIGSYHGALLLLINENQQWPQIKEELDSAEKEFLAACAAKGLQPDDVSRLQDLDKQRHLKQEELSLKDKQAELIQGKAAEFSQSLTELHDLWKQQYQTRERVCTEIRERSDATLVEIVYMRDESSFNAAWERLSPKDSRTKLGRNWLILGNELFGVFNPKKDLSPWEVLEQWRVDVLTIPPGLQFNGLITEVSSYLDSEDIRSVWENVRLTRIADFIDVELLRGDGSSAGKMSGAGGKTLSEGQRNTAVLNLMLAEGNGPIVIDQPEDELDSNFIYSDLVPLLRRIKVNRQLIMATHNANLPVNADAEMIIAVEAREGQGKYRSQGGLDQKDVALAVLDIMEGSETAFKRRSEKYHF